LNGHLHSQIRPQAGGNPATAAAAKLALFSCLSHACSQVNFLCRHPQKSIYIKRRSRHTIHDRAIATRGEFTGRACARVLSQSHSALVPVNRLPHMPSLLYSSPCGVGAYGSGDAEGGLIAQQRSRCVREDAGCAHELSEGFEADRVRSVMNESIEQLVNLFVVDNT